MKLNRLKIVLAQQGRTNKWLAEQLGKSQVSISRWCNNTAQPSLESLWQTAKVLGVDIRELINSNKSSK